MVSKRIGKNRKKFIDEIFKHGTNFTGYHYQESVSYTKEDLTFKTSKSHVKSELFKWKFAYLYCDFSTGKCTVHIHGNKWYNFETPVKILKAGTPGARKYKPKPKKEITLKITENRTFLLESVKMYGQKEGIRSLIVSSAWAGGMTDSTAKNNIEYLVNKKLISKKRGKSKYGYDVYLTSLTPRGKKVLAQYKKEGKKILNL